MKEKKSNIGKYLLILVPFVMGVTGFTVLDGQPVVDSLFLSMEMYFLNYSDSPPNILIEIARWTAPLMTASGVLMSISKIRGKILQLLRYYRGDSIAVEIKTYGQGSDRLYDPFSCGNFDPRKQCVHIRTGTSAYLQ